MREFFCCVTLDGDLEPLHNLSGPVSNWPFGAWVYFRSMDEAMAHCVEQFDPFQCPWQGRVQD